MERLRTVKEVADILGVSQTTIYRMMSDGRLNPLRLTDRIVRFTEEEIERFKATGKPPEEVTL